MLNLFRKFVASRLVNAIPFLGRFARWLATAPGARRYVAMFALTVKLSVAAVAGVIMGVCQPFADLAGAVCSVDVNSWVAASASLADSLTAWLDKGADITALLVVAWSYFEHKDSQKS